MCLAQGQGKLPALLIAKLKSLHLIGPVIHEGIIQRGSQSKTQIGSFYYQKNNEGFVTNELSESLQTAFCVPETKLFVAWAPQNHCHKAVNIKQAITTTFKDTLSLNMRNTSLFFFVCVSFCHVVWAEGMALNTVCCLVLGCVVTNERPLLGFGGQSTYNAVFWEWKEEKNK